MQMMNRNPFRTARRKGARNRRGSVAVIAGLSFAILAAMAGLVVGSWTERNYIEFHEYFEGDTGKGLGASHQTGWSGLVAALIAGI